MSELDSLLIELSQKRSSDLSSKNRIKVTDDLQIKKVAFDMYKVLKDQYNDLWKVEDIEGEKFLVRSSDPKYSAKEEGDWVVTGNYDGDNVTLSYKKVPICSFSSDEFGFCSDDIFTFKSALLDMIDEDASFVKKVISRQPKAKVAAIESLFPELLK
tara:strand:- start:2298 stop:2768 length:471 start_codon:yes stop_codon:yes gene_type:complete